MELKLLRSENPTFSLSWTTLHPIDEASPLFGRSGGDLIREDALFVLNITGHDESSGQAVQARETYLSRDLHWDHRYVDVLSTTDDGVTVLDYARFHDVEPVASSAATPAA